MGKVGGWMGGGEEEKADWVVWCGGCGGGGCGLAKPCEPRTFVVGRGGGRGGGGEWMDTRATSA